MSKLIKAIKNSKAPKTVTKIHTMTQTENGAITPSTSKSSLVDFFALGGALRNTPEANVLSLFSNAFNEDKLLATKIAFYFRDVRGGQGQRKAFRTMLSWLANNNPKIVVRNLANVAEFGRFDDLFCLFGTKVEDEVTSFLVKQVKADLKLMKKGEAISLLAKWMPSEGSSEALIAKKLMKALDMSPKTYRKMLTSLRKYLNVVEVKMSSKNWNEIDYESVPSRASMIYRKAFGKHDPIGYTAYLGKVATGEAKINASVLYPHELVQKAQSGVDPTVELQWRALPNYLEENPHNGLCLVDVSGSMAGQPMLVSVGLGIYMAERIEGFFKNHFITFEASPSLLQVQGSSLTERVLNVMRAPWGGNTNLQAAFDLILNAAVANKVPKKEMPDVLYILSDMQFDKACDNNSKSNFETIKQKFDKAGYKVPHVVFWNLDARVNTGQSPVEMDERGATLVSGFSPSIFKTVLSGKNFTPYDTMMEVIGQERYNKVTV